MEPTQAYMFFRGESHGGMGVLGHAGQNPEWPHPTLWKARDTGTVWRVFTEDMDMIDTTSLRSWLRKPHPTGDVWYAHSTHAVVVARVVAKKGG